MTAVKEQIDIRALQQEFRQRFQQQSQTFKAIDFALLRTMLAAQAKQVSYTTQEEYYAHLLSHEIAQASTQAGIVVFKKEQSVAQEFPRADLRVLNQMYGFEEIFNLFNAQKKHDFSFDYGVLKVGLSLKPISKRQSPFENVARYEHMRAEAQHQVECNPIAKLEYALQKNYCVSLTKRMLDYSSNPDALTAQLSVNSLSLICIDDEGVILMDCVKPQLQKLLWNNYGFCGIDTKEKLGKLLEIIDPFLKEALSKDEYIAFLKDCIVREIPGANLLLQRALGSNSIWDKFKCVASYFKPNFDALKDEEIAQSRMMQHYAHIESLCAGDKFEQARLFLDELPRKWKATSSESLIAQANERHYLNLIYQQRYSKIYNDYGIRYEDTQDPYYCISKTLLDTCPSAEKPQLLAIVQETVTYRSDKLKKLLSNATKAQKESSFFKAVGYRIVDAQTNHELIDALSFLSKNHEEEIHKEAYSYFMCGGVPRSFEKNELANVTKIPVVIEQTGFEEARKWYGYCVTHKLEDQVQKKLIEQAIKYISASCQSQKYQQEYLYAAQRLYQAIDCNDFNAAIVTLPNFIQVSTIIEQAALKEQLLVQAVSKLKELKLSELGQEEFAVQEVVVVSNIQNAFRAIETGKIKNLDEIQHWLNPCVNEIYAKSATSEIYPAKVEQLTEQEEFVPPYGCGNVLIDEILRAFTDFEKDDFLWEEPPYFPGQEKPGSLFDPELQEIEEEIDVDDIPQCNGGQQTLPEFGKAEIAEDNSRETDKEQIEEIDSDIQKIIEQKTEEIIEEWKDKNSEVILQVEKIVRWIQKDSHVYGVENIIEVLELLPIKDWNLKKYKNFQFKFMQLVIDLSKINSDSRWLKFKYDVAQGGCTKISTIDEAIAGIACEEQGLLGTLYRSKNESEEFIEHVSEGTVAWDVKTFPAYTNDGAKYIFNPIRYTESIIKELNGKENVIVNIIYLSPEETDLLIQEIVSKISKEDLRRIVFVHPKNRLETDRILKAMKQFKD